MGLRNSGNYNLGSGCSGAPGYILIKILEHMDIVGHGEINVIDRKNTKDPIIS